MAIIGAIVVAIVEAAPFAAAGLVIGTMLWVFFGEVTGVTFGLTPEDGVKTFAAPEDGVKAYVTLTLKNAVLTTITVTVGVGIGAAVGAGIGSLVGAVSEGAVYGRKTSALISLIIVYTLYQEYRIGYNDLFIVYILFVYVIVYIIFVYVIVYILFVYAIAYI